MPIFYASASTHIIAVSNNQFTPANLNVLVGDIIRWEWSAGFHNTASLNIPAGAADWLSPYLTGNGDFFEYTVLVAGPYEYYCEVHGVGMSGNFTASGSLPVTLSNFYVNNRQDKPYLTWTPTAELNTDYFAVRRSYDGTVFTEIASVPAAGSSQQTRNYSYLDSRINANKRFVYYELAITDIDGKVQLSPIRLYKNADAAPTLITSISPNPVSQAGHLLIQFNAETSGDLFARLIDLNGKLLLFAKLSASEGINNSHIHLAAIPAGNYIIQFTLDSKTETYKIKKE